MSEAGASNLKGSRKGLKKAHSTGSLAASPDEVPSTNSADSSVPSSDEVSVSSRTRSLSSIIRARVKALPERASLRKKKKMANKTKQQPTTRRVTTPRPSCTHVVMDKIYSPSLVCSVCNRPSPLGFLYHCQQDSSKCNTSFAADRLRKRLYKHRPSISPKEAQLPEPVTKLIREGFYTDEQVQIMKEQKAHVRKTIDSVANEKEALKSKTGPDASILSAKLAALDSTFDSAYEQSQNLLATLKSQSLVNKAFGPCDFKVCHTCRPFSRERTFVSFESVFSGEVEPPRTWVPEYMPVHNARIVRNLGLNGVRNPGTSTAQSSYESFVSASGTAELEARDDWPLPHEAKVTPSYHIEADEPNESKGFRNSLERALQDMLSFERAGTGPDRTHMTASLNERLSRHLRSDDANEFDLDLCKTLLNEWQDTAASIHLPGEDGMDVDLEDTVQEAKPLEEKHVEGGLALTEEAVENNLPDIVTSV